jgi:hypothetical protein
MFQELVDAHADQAYGPELRDFAKLHQIQFIQQEHGPDQYQDGPQQDLCTHSIASVVRHVQNLLTVWKLSSGENRVSIFSANERRTPGNGRRNPRRRMVF